MAAFVKSTKTNEVVLVFPDGKDFRFIGLDLNKVDELRMKVQLIYVNQSPEKTLEIYGVPENSLRKHT